MGNFDKVKKFGGGRDGKRFDGRSFGGDRGGRGSFGGGRREGGSPDMHKAVCSDCGKTCEVPFRPTGDKPVFCSDCFRSKRDDSGSRNKGGDYGSKPRFESKKPYQSEGSRSVPDYKAQFEMLNTKLDKILKALNPIVAEVIENPAPTTSKKFEKAPKKEVDTVALKKALSNSKAPAAKKPEMEKKSVAKKAPAKKAVVKKAPAKKVVAKKKK